MTTLLFFDDYHVGDPLFQTDLGRRLSRLPAGSRTIILHRVDEAVERALEHLDGQDDAPTLVERAIRETNQQITRRLTEEGVPAVSVQGSDQSLFILDADDSPVAVRAGGVDWLDRTVSLGTIPVISPIARVIGERGLVRTADPVGCAVALSSTLRSEGNEVHGVIFCSTRKGGLYREKKLLQTIAVSDLGSFSEVIDQAAASALAPATDRLVATNSVALAKGHPITGTIISQPV